MPLFIDCSSEDLCEAVRRALSGSRRPDSESDISHVLARLESVADASGLETFVIGRSSDLYPSLVRQMTSPPAAIFGCGRIDAFRRLSESLENNRSFAVSGARRASAYGREVAYSIAQSRVSDDHRSVVLSTMALGVAGAATRGALQTGVHDSVVVALAGSPLIAYPRSHRLLHEQVTARGCAISCSPFIEGFGATLELVAEQREFLAALSPQLVVVEGNEGSGTHEVVQAAVRMSRTVHAIPGPVTSPLSLLPNQLIASGVARCLTDCIAADLD